MPSLHTPSPCTLAHTGLSLNSKPLCSPSRLGWDPPVKGASGLPPLHCPAGSLSPTDGSANPCLPSPRANWVSPGRMFAVILTNQVQATDQELAKRVVHSRLALNSPSNPIFFLPAEGISRQDLRPNTRFHPLFPCPTPTFAPKDELYRIPSAAVPKRQDHPSPASSPCARGTSYTLRTGPLEPRPSLPQSSPQTLMYVYTHYFHALQTTLRIYTFLHLPRWHT